MSECSSINTEVTDLRSDDIPDSAVHNNQDSKDICNETNTHSDNTVEGTKCLEKTAEILQNNENRITENDEKKVDVNEENSELCKKVEELGEGDIIPDDMIGEESDSDDDDEDDDDSDDDDGWITPSNIRSVKEKMGGSDVEKAEVSVGCLTTDFAMQVHFYLSFIISFYQTVMVIRQYKYIKISFIYIKKIKIYIGCKLVSQTLNLLNFLNGIFHLPFLKQSIIILGISRQELEVGQPTVTHNIEPGQTAG